MTDQTSELLYMRAKLRLPGGVNSPVRAYQAVGRTPRFIQSRKGSHITDVDGNEMIDYVCSWGPGILGHADPRVIKNFIENVYPLYINNNRVDILLNYTDFGVG